MNRAIFLDRDGVIIQEPPHYPHTREQMVIIPKTEHAIKLMNENSFKTIIVTNQSGVSKGYFTENDLIHFNNLMIEKLKKDRAKIDAIYYCCHNPEDNCDCRKPKSGMLKRAIEEFDIDIKHSFIIGDKKSDIDAGKNIGIKTALVLTGYGIEEMKKYKIDCDIVANDLYDAINKILG